MDIDNSLKSVDTKPNPNVSEYEVCMEKAKQSIVYGSPYEALIKNFVTVKDILNYLLCNNINFKTMIAYRAVCQFSTDQIIRGNPNPEFNDKPFIVLTNRDEYVGIYNLSLCTNGQIPGRTDAERIEIAKKTQRVWPKLMNLSDFSKGIYLVCDHTQVKLRIKPTERWVVVGARSIKIISKLFLDLLPHYDTWLDNDYLEPLEHLKYPTYEKALLDRCSKLKENAPLYWNNVAIHLYKDVVCKNIDTETPKMNREMIKQYVVLFPGLFPPEMTNMSDLTYNIRQLPEMVQAYVLGYPIHKYVPSTAILNETINMLNELGPEKYCELIGEQNKNCMNNHADMVNPLNLAKEILWGNEGQDALMENIWDYNTFDVIRYYIDTHVYFFTRPAFSTLATKKKNFLTNKLLPLPVVSEVIARAEITSRIETALVCTLPPPAPLQELLERVEKGTLYNTPGNQQTQPAQPVQPLSGGELLTPSDIRGRINNRPGRMNNLGQALTGVSISVPIAQLPPLPNLPQLEGSAIRQRRNPPRTQSAMNQGRTNMINLLSATHLIEELPDMNNLLERLAETVFGMASPTNPLFGMANPANPPSPHQPQPQPPSQPAPHFHGSMLDGRSILNHLLANVDNNSNITIVGNLFDSTDEDMDSYDEEEEEEESVDSSPPLDTEEDELELVD